MLDDHAGNLTPGISDVPLGIIAGTEYSQIAISLNPGDVVLMYSDSLNESHNESGIQLHEEGLLDLVKMLDASDGATLCKATVEAVSAYRGGASADDDESVLIVWRPSEQASKT